MASRRCLLRLLSRRLVPQRSQPVAPVSIAARTLTSLSEPLSSLAPRALASPRLYYPSRCHFATRSSGDEEEEDEEEHYDDEGSEGEWGEEDEAVAAKKPSGKTEEEKLAEAAEIGYKVVGPLGADEKPFKPYEPVFAVVQIGSHQFKVSNGDSIFTERLKFCDVNDKLILNRVLMLGSQTQTVIGRPILTEAAVHAVVEEHALDAKVIIFKKKRRKNYRRTKGHRQAWTNDRLYAPFHRITVAGDVTRYSAMLFSVPNFEVQAPAELVDDEHPPRFKPHDNNDFICFCVSEEGARHEDKLKGFCGL